MKKYNNFELLLHAAAEECVEEEAKEFLAQDTSDVESQIQKRKQVEKLIKRKYHPGIKKHRYRNLLAIAALLIVVLVSTACFSFTDMGKKAYHAVVEFLDKYISIDFEENEALETITDDTESVCETETAPPPVTPPLTLEKKAFASYLPSTYTCRIDGETTSYYMLSYYDLESNWVFSVIQSTITKDSHLSDYEGQATEFINIHGNRAILVKDETQSDFYTLIWRDSSYEYTVYGIFKEINTLKKIAEGITLG